MICRRSLVLDLLEIDKVSLEPCEQGVLPQVADHREEVDSDHRGERATGVESAAAQRPDVPEADVRISHAPERRST